MLRGWHIVIHSVLTTTLGFQARRAHVGTEESEITTPWEATKAQKDIVPVCQDPIRSSGFLRTCVK